MANVKYNIYNKYLEVFTWLLLRRPNHVVLMNSWNIEFW